MACETREGATNFGLPAVCEFEVYDGEDDGECHWEHEDEPSGDECSEWFLAMYYYPILDETVAVEDDLGLTLVRLLKMVKANMWWYGTRIPIAMDPCLTEELSDPLLISSPMFPDESVLCLTLIA